MKKLITEAFDKEANDNLNKVCEEIATGTLDALGFVKHNNTFMCAIVDKKNYDACGEDRIDRNMICASGWYLEWAMNDDCYLILKSSYQMTEKLQNETEEIKNNLKNPDYGAIAYGEKVWPKGDQQI